MQNGTLLSGRYQIVDLLEKSNLNTVYLAKDQLIPFHPLCVVKQLKQEDIDGEVLRFSRQLLDREAEILAQLVSHPRIPRLLAYFEEEGRTYLVQDYIHGHSLSEELYSGNIWPEKKVFCLLNEILQILMFVHSKGVIHGDIKPANIMRRKLDGGFVLIDFGSAKYNYSSVEQKQSSFSPITGTLNYMPAEQVRGKPRFCSDLFSLGIMGIQAVTGLHPSQFLEDSEGEILWQKQANVSHEFADILAKMVRYHFKDRFQTAEEVLLCLRAQETLCRQETTSVLLSEPLSSESLLSESLLSETLLSETRSYLELDGLNLGTQADLDLMTDLMIDKDWSLDKLPWPEPPSDPPSPLNPENNTASIQKASEPVLETLNLLVWVSGTFVCTLPSNRVLDILAPEQYASVLSDEQSALQWQGNSCCRYHLSNLLRYDHLLLGATFDEASRRLSIEEDESGLILVIGLDDQKIALDVEVDCLVVKPCIELKALEPTTSLPSYYCGYSTFDGDRLLPVIDVLSLLNGMISFDVEPANEQPTQIQQTTQTNAQTNDDLFLTEGAIVQPNSCKILVIDDSVTLRNILSRTLMSMGYSVLEAENGLEAITKLLTQPVELVICDLEMPHMNGLEFLRYCRYFPELTKIPVVMLTMQSSEENKRLALELGATAYFTKPFVESDFLAAIGALI